MDYQVLGHLTAGGAPVRGQRGRDLLALLLVRRGRALAPEVILDRVWGEEAHRLDASVVHTVIARLRRALGAGAIVRGDAGYQLAPDCAVDADAFLRLVAAARSLVPERGGEVTALLREALGLWCGPEAYAGVSSAIVAAERPRLQAMRDDAVEELAARLLAGTGDELAAPGATETGRGRLNEAVHLAADLLAREPLRERACELVMEGLYRLGRQAESLAAYDQLRRTLRIELGIDPSPTTSALHARILAQDLGLVSSAPPARIARRRSRQAPRPRTPTIGRAAEVAAVVGELGAGRRLITVIGPGGVGKSRLLAEIAGATDVSHLYVEVPRSTAAGPGEVVLAIARAAGVPLPGGDPLEAIAGLLRASEPLVLLDEAEWALAACREVIARILRDSPATQILVTSRSPLDLLGEHRFALAPLATPRLGARQDRQSATPAVRLLVERLADHAPDMELSDDDYARVAAIARRVDGLPLALEIIAGQAASSSVRELLDLVQAPLDLSTTEADRVERHRTLRETMTWSLERLPPASRTALIRLGVFTGSFDMAAAEAVVGALADTTPAPGRAAAHVSVPAVVRGLIREAQLQVERRDGGIRLRMLRPAQDLARELLHTRGEEAQTRRRHRSWYAARWRDQLLSDALVADVAAGYPDYRAALVSALQAGEADTVGDLAITLSRYWFFVETGSEGIALVREALASGLLDPRHRAILRLLEAALIPQDQGAQVRSELEELIGELDDDPDWLGRLHILRSVGPYVHGDFPAALAATEEAVTLSRERAGHHLPEALGAYAVMLAALARTEEAVAAATEAWRLIADGPSAVDLTQVVPKVALALMDSDHPRLALEILDRALEQVEDRLGLGPVSLFTTNAGWAALGSGRPAVALTRFAQSVDQLAEGGDLLVVGELFSGAGAAMIDLGSPGAAEVLALGADRLARAQAVLSPWQARLVAAREGSGPAGPGQAFAVMDLTGAAELVRDAAHQHRPAAP